MKIKWILFCLLMILFTACATVFGGKKNTLYVKGVPEVAEVYLDGKLIGKTPLKIRISKYMLQEGSIVDVKTNGYETVSYEVVRRPHVGYVLLNVVSGAVPLIVDVANGNIYRPNTRQIEYELSIIKKEEKAVKTNDSNSKN
jgi:hypothetical protein